MEQRIQKLRTENIPVGSAVVGDIACDFTSRIKKVSIQFFLTKVSHLLWRFGQ